MAGQGLPLLRWRAAPMRAEQRQQGKTMNKVHVAAFVMAMGLALPAAAQFEGTSGVGGSLLAARDLYASARYDEALTVLNGLRIGDNVDRRSVEQYRALCLLALGRTSEAETAIAAVVTADPMYRPSESESAPRVRAAFTDVRKRLLPELILARYAQAKATYDRKDWPVAEQQFTIVVALIDDPDNGGRLTDLRMLASGFLELSAKAAAPPPPPPAPTVDARPAAVVSAATPAPIPAAPAAAAVPTPGKIYIVDDPGVTPPAVLRQDIPNIPQPLMSSAKTRGLLEVIVDERGRVISMSVRSSIHPLYDSQLLAAARDWRYKPATFNGQPVPFRRLIQVAVKR
jgi:TonB family protein